VRPRGRHRRGADPPGTRSHHRVSLLPRGPTSATPRRLPGGMIAERRPADPPRDGTEPSIRPPRAARPNDVRFPGDPAVDARTLDGVEQRDQRTGILLVLAAGVLWATVGPAQVVAGSVVDPAALGGARILIGGLVLAAVVLATAAPRGVRGHRALPGRPPDVPGRHR